MGQAKPKTLPAAAKKQIAKKQPAYKAPAKKPAAKKPEQKSKNGSLRAQKNQPAQKGKPSSSKPKLKTSPAQAKPKKHGHHNNFDHKGSMHRTPLHKDAVKKVAQLFCYTSPQEA